RPDRGPAQTADDIRELRPARMDIDGHRQECVDERYRVRARILGGAPKGSDVGDIWRQLRNNREGSHRAHRTDDAVRAAQVASERDPAFFNVRAGNVELDGRHALVI